LTVAEEVEHSRERPNERYPNRESADAGPHGLGIYHSL